VPENILPKKDLQRKAKVNMWLAWSQGTLRPSLVNIFRMDMQLMISKKERMPKETRRIMTSFAVQKFRELDELLGASKGKFLIDDELTVADLSVFTELTCADQFGVKVDKFPNVLKFYEEVREGRGS